MFILLGSLFLAFASTGCNYIVMANYALEGTGKTPAEHALEPWETLVFIDDLMVGYGSSGYRYNTGIDRLFGLGRGPYRTGADTNIVDLLGNRFNRGKAGFGAQRDLDHADTAGHQRTGGFDRRCGIGHHHDRNHRRDRHHLTCLVLQELTLRRLVR